MVVTTLPDKSGELLRLRMSRSTTLAPDGSVQADLLYLSTFQILRTGLPGAASEVEVVKVRGVESGPEAITLLTPLYLSSILARKGEKRHSSPS